jgi:hypothetical protein
MPKIFLKACGLVVVFFGVAGMAHADVSCGPPESGLPAESSASEFCHSQGGFPAPLPYQFTIPQFDPLLGQLQSVELEFAIFNASGTVFYTYPGIPPNCPPYLGACYDFATGVIYSATLSSGNFLSVSVGPTEYCIIPGLSYTCSGGPGVQGGGGAPGDYSLPWSDLHNYAAFLSYDVSQVTPFIGTGLLTFDVNGSAFGVGTENGSVNYVTVDSIPYQVTFEYDYITSEAPAVPEPSLLFVTGALFGLLVMLAMRRNPDVV